MVNDLMMDCEMLSKMCDGGRESGLQADGGCPVHRVS